MARRKTICQADFELAARLRTLRGLRRLSRVAFAQRIGIDSARIASYEFARARLPLSVAQVLFKKCWVSAEWLASGALPVLRADFGWLFEQSLPEGREIGLREPFLDLWKECAQRYMEEVSLDPSWSTSGHYSPEMLADWDLTGYSLWGIDLASMLSTPMSVKDLLLRVKRLCEMRGQRTIAEQVGVSTQRLNDWLHERREPGGDATLRLLRLVQAKVNSPSNDPGGGRHAAGAGTRKSAR